VVHSPCRDRALHLDFPGSHGDHQGPESAVVAGTGLEEVGHSRTVADSGTEEVAGRGIDSAVVGEEEAVAAVATPVALTESRSLACCLDYASLTSKAVCRIRRSEGRQHGKYPHYFCALGGIL